MCVSNIYDKLFEWINRLPGHSVFAVNVSMLKGRTEANFCYVTNTSLQLFSLCTADKGLRGRKRPVSIVYYPSATSDAHNLLFQITLT